MMWIKVFEGIIISFLGTALGSACVFFMKKSSAVLFSGRSRVSLPVRWSTKSLKLIPEMSAGEHSNVGVFLFALGFTLMIALDVALG